ncbi:MAG: FAD-dependent monooxygenase, partial [Alphaproteobacteria bacterium]|nr:FAD-dependent monooxygenase [Alphaproteobacteria bacterium]
GGIGGLTLAGALARFGVPFLLLEQADELAEVGAGIQIGPNGVHVMRFLGIMEALDELACLPPSYNARDWKTGKLLYSMPRNPHFAEKYDAPYYQIHRADLLDTLQTAVPAERIHLGQQVTALRQEGDRVVIETAKGDTFEAAAVIGADGIHSVVREALFGPDKPRYAGMVIYRLTAETAALDPELAKIGAGTYHGPHAHVTVYPISGGRRINFAGAFEIAEWQTESWSLECGKDEVHAAYEGWDPDLHGLIEASERINKWALFDRDPLPQWTKGRVSLLGDAAHPMLPFMAQGACMAIEDAYVAAALLARGVDGPAAALMDYENARRARTAKVQLGARSRVAALHEPTAMGRALRNLSYVVSGLLRREGKRFDPDWIYGTNVVDEFPVPDKTIA